MKKTALKESKVLLEVRRIKEEMAREADTDPGYYRCLNGLGAKLPVPYRKKAKKWFGVKPREILVDLESYMLDL